MSSEQQFAEVEEETEDELTDGEIRETFRGMQARIEKLEEENDDLREEIRKREQNMVSRPMMNQLIAALVNDRESIDFSADPFDNRDALQDFGTRVESTEVQVQQLNSKVDSIYDGSADGPEQAWLEIVEAAKRLKTDSSHGLPKNRVKLYKENIAQATGKGEKMAQNYIEDFGKGKDGTDWQPYQRACAANNNKAQKKALIVDLNVWGDDDE